MSQYDFRTNPHKHYYDSRRSDVRLIVIHTAENLPDFEGEDRGAEAVARYGATTSRPVSWHATVDSDSVLANLPDAYTAFHVRGFNSASLGVEVATQARKWASAPDEWVDNTLENLALLVAGWCKKHDIPPVKLTKREAKTERGIVAHSTLDPKRRSDPGKDFPWDRLLERVAELLDKPKASAAPKAKPKPKKKSTTKSEDTIVAKLPTLKKGMPRSEHVTILQHLLALDSQPINVDGIFGPETERAVRQFQSQEKVSVDGIVGPVTWGKLLHV